MGIAIVLVSDLNSDDLNDEIYQSSYSTWDKLRQAVQSVIDPTEWQNYVQRLFMSEGYFKPAECYKMYLFLNSLLGLSKLKGWAYQLNNLKNGFWRAFMSKKIVLYC